MVCLRACLVRSSICRCAPLVYAVPHTLLVDSASHQACALEPLLSLPPRPPFAPPPRSSPLSSSSICIDMHYTLHALAACSLQYVGGKFAGRGECIERVHDNGYVSLFSPASPFASDLPMGEGGHDGLMHLLGIVCASGWRCRLSFCP